MRLWMALAALLPACGFDAGSKSDGGRDAPPDGQQCFGTFVRTCFSSAAAIPSDRKSTRLNSSHLVISYAVFCLKKKKYILNVSVAVVRAGRSEMERVSPHDESGALASVCLYVRPRRPASRRVECGCDPC